MRGILLFTIAVLILGIVYFPALFIGLVTINQNDYLFTLAQAIDRFGNSLLSPIFNKILITSDGIKFGDGRETISSVTGRNIIKGTLTKTGNLFAYLLDICFGKNHCIDSIGY
jgi:hypothetical protein